MNLFLFQLFENPVFFLTWVVVIVISICLHELGHGYAAIYEGDDTPVRRGHMTWNPMVHLGPPSIVFLLMTGMAWGAMPVTPSKFRSRFGGAMVAFAGPLTNFAIAVVCTFTIDVLLMLFPLESVLPVLNFLGYAAQINIVLGLFNLIPVPPLDGFVVAKHFFPDLRKVEGTPLGKYAIFILFFTGASRWLWWISERAIVYLINA